MSGDDFEPEPDASSTTRHVGIYEFVLLDAGEEHSPPRQPVLRVALVEDGTVSLAIEEYEEDAKTSTYRRVASVIVDLEPLYNGLNACVKSDGRKQV